MKPTNKQYWDAEQKGISRNHVNARLRIGWDIERAITEPINRKKVVYYLRGREHAD